MCMFTRARVGVSVDVFYLVVCFPSWCDREGAKREIMSKLATWRQTWRLHEDGKMIWDVTCALTTKSIPIHPLKKRIDLKLQSKRQNSNDIRSA